MNKKMQMMQSEIQQKAIWCSRQKQVRAMFTNPPENSRSIRLVFQATYDTIKNNILWAQKRKK